MPSFIIESPTQPWPPTTLKTTAIRRGCWPPQPCATFWAQRTLPRSCRSEKQSVKLCKTPWTKPQIPGVWRYQTWRESHNWEVWWLLFSLFFRPSAWRCKWFLPRSRFFSQFSTSSFACSKDVRLPVQLQRAMAAEAEAAREARAKVRFRSVKMTFRKWNDDAPLYYPSSLFS